MDIRYIIDMSQQPLKSQEEPFLMGIGGCSSSGKTTIAKITADLLPNAILIHQDDFFKHDEEIPVNEKYGIQDWDSPDALDLELFNSELEVVKRTGMVASELIHNDNVDDTRKFESELSYEVLQRLRDRYSLGLSSSSSSSNNNGRRIVIVDGFMLYNDPRIRSKFDLKLLIRAPYETLKRRRQARPGYKTLDSYWVDPPYYFDEFVYRSYKDTHGELFVNGNVEGELDPVRAHDITDFVNDDGVSIADALEWVADRILEHCSSERN